MNLQSKETSVLVSPNISGENQFQNSCKIHYHAEGDIIVSEYFCRGPDVIPRVQMWFNF